MNENKLALAVMMKGLGYETSVVANKLTVPKEEVEQDMAELRKRAEEEGFKPVFWDVILKEVFNEKLVMEVARRLS